jgi:ubiquinone/menaquinone biosynthesis C-methylase UbiE
MANELFKFSGSLAASYDQYLGPFLFEPYGKQMALRVARQSKASVLEIASGTGRVTRHLRDGLPQDTRLIASDLSPDMLQVAREKLKDKQGIEFIIADMQALPFAEESFDAVVCQFGIMFLPDKQKGFEEAYRVLAPGGKFFFSTWQRTEAVEILNIVYDRYVLPFFKDEDPSRFKIPYSMWNHPSLKELLRESHFEDIHIEDVRVNAVSPSAADIVAGCFRTHAIGKEVADRDPKAFETISQQIKEDIIKTFGDHPVECELTAVFGTGTKR